MCKKNKEIWYISENFESKKLSNDIEIFYSPQIVEICHWLVLKNRHVSTYVCLETESTRKIWTVQEEAQKNLPKEQTKAKSTCPLATIFFEKEETWWTKCCQQIRVAMHALVSGVTWRWSVSRWSQEDTCRCSSRRFPCVQNWKCPKS